MFEVFKYVLPRFRIDLHYPKLIYYKTNTFDIKICGQYSYGKHVRGLAFVKVTDSYNNMLPVHQMKEVSVFLRLTFSCSCFIPTVEI